MVSSGTYMDIVFTGAGLVDFNSYAARNAFTAIEDYIDEYLPKTKEQLPQGSWDGYTYDGHIYAVPPMKDLAARWGWLANQTMIDDLGVPFPEKFDTAADRIDWLYDSKEAREMCIRDSLRADRDPNQGPDPVRSPQGGRSAPIHPGAGPGSQNQRYHHQEGLR